MPTPTECVRILRGSESEKLALMDYYISVIQSGGNIADWEGIILAALRKDLLISEPIEMNVSSTLTGAGGVSF